ncbi:GNAT family N-acetyltransferase [Kordia jejudonensis]|uniref:GNAT family N-acetyltransferase n=1 Tax=Kordia jejudonensis TaxID=1348245 RepID=UPI0006299A83|nr:GNAT family N-acetyltransferase [Kordia jejudonensis]
MTTIREATLNDVERIITLGTKTLLDTYLATTPEKAVRSFAAQVFNKDTLKEEIQSNTVFYHLIFHEATLVGYSKIVLDTESEHIPQQPITKLDRFYILKEFHGKKLGQQLFDFFVDFAKQKQQLGIWLYVLIANERAVNFYTKNNFQVVAYHDFVVSETHTNPNHVMFLEF